MKKIAQITQIFILILISQNSFASVQSEKSLESVIQTSCPFVEGTSVYKARVLWSNFEPDALFDDKVICNPQILVKNSEAGITTNSNIDIPRHRVSASGRCDFCNEIVLSNIGSNKWISSS